MSGCLDFCSISKQSSVSVSRFFSRKPSVCVNEKRNEHGELESAKSNGIETGAKAVGTDEETEPRSIHFRRQDRTTANEGRQDKSEERKESSVGTYVVAHVAGVVDDNELLGVLQNLLVVLGLLVRLHIGTVQQMSEPIQATRFFRIL
jgi:hypothetical protein